MVLLLVRLFGRKQNERVAPLGRQVIPKHEEGKGELPWQREMA
jgi:hypothetical protein